MQLLIRHDPHSSKWENVSAKINSILYDLTRDAQNTFTPYCTQNETQITINGDVDNHGRRHE